MAKKLRITLVKSPLARNSKHRGTIKALGLKKIGQTVEHKDTPVIRGMASTVSYLINVEETK